MKLKVRDVDGNHVGDYDLNLDDFYPSSILSIQRNVLALMNNRRLVRPAHYKSISGVDGTARKPHPQKRTGRARQGTLRAIHMRHGAVKFGFSGDRVRDSSRRYRSFLHVNHAEKKKNLLSVIVNRIENDHLHVVEDLSKHTRTCDAHASFVRNGWENAVVVYDSIYPRALSSLNLNIHSLSGVNLIRLIARRLLIIEKNAMIKLVERCAR